MTAIAKETSGMKNEQSLLNLICVAGAAGLFAFVGYNLLAAGTVISTDGLFFTVVPTMIALSLLAMPLQQVLSQRLEKRRIARGEVTPATNAPTRVGAGSGSAPAALRTAPALKDQKGRALPPDVNRMVAELNKAESGKQ